MSFTPLYKITLVGLMQEKKALLEELQSLGSLHIIPLAESATAESGTSAKSREALQFLLSSPHKFKQVTKDAHFDAEKIERDALALRQKIDALNADRDRLIELIEERRPWGNFNPPTANELRGQRVWLYRVPVYQHTLVENSKLTWELVGRDNQFNYVAVVGEDEPPPEAMPVPPLRADERSLSQLEERLEEVELSIGDAQAERESMTRWCLLLSQSMNRLDDASALAQVQGQTRDAGPVFALQAWIPQNQLPRLQAFASDRALILEAHPPEPSEVPPTKFRNPELISGGEELVSFYMTPSYWLCDPSAVVFFSFGIFFAMIMSDAGYGAIMALLVAVFWKPLGKTELSRRWRTICAWISILTIVYGVLVGSYFGVEPRSGFLKSFHVLDMKNYGPMMLISVLIGAVHVTLANLMNAWRFGRDLRALAPLGWAIMVVGGTAAALGSKYGSAKVKAVGFAAIAIGALMVVLFTAADQPAGKRLIGGLLGLTRITSAFGDVLSYLRLFALGLASASLAAVFNGMAQSLYNKWAGIGIVFAVGVLLFGHIVNLFLSISGGFIHGLRLNVIEFFNWGVQEEGNLYRPFFRKESISWKR